MSTIFDSFIQSMGKLPVADFLGSMKSNTLYFAPAGKGSDPMVKVKSIVIWELLILFFNFSSYCVNLIKHIMLHPAYFIGDFQALRLCM